MLKVNKEVMLHDRTARSADNTTQIVQGVALGTFSGLTENW
jgi:hypothetical protein